MPCRSSIFFINFSRASDSVDASIESTRSVQSDIAIFSFGTEYCIMYVFMVVIW